MGNLNVFEQGLLFEENYLRRTHKTLTSNPAIALTELVANAWDAGATSVNITIPSAIGDEIVVSDNGTGLTFEEFQDRWFKLGYDRLAHQGKNVKFPDDIGAQQGRIAFGRNGIGRHGMFCFNERYEIISQKGGKEFRAQIGSTKEHPINLESHSIRDIGSSIHGTLLKAIVAEHLPDPQEMLHALSARFVTDPNFRIIINEETAHLETLSGAVETRELHIGEIKIILHFIDTEKSLRKGVYQGVAFWQNHRLVGEPSWTLGKETIIDGRRSDAKRYIFIAETNDLGQFVKEDWTGFIQSPVIDNVFSAIRSAVMEAIGKANLENATTLQEQVKNDYGKQYDSLSQLAKVQVSESFEQIVAKHPTEGRMAYEIALETVVKIANERSGQELLSKISALDPTEVDALNAILEKWSVKDALVVLEEIDRRISTIEAIRRLSDRPDTDEVHVLEPLITEAKWIFGPEFDSMEFCANNQLRTIAKRVFGISDADFANGKKRPDLFVVADSTYSMTGISEMTDGISTLKRVLIVEIKRGAYHITRTEKDQAQHYVEDILAAGLGNLHVDSFVVGSSIDPKAALPITVGEGAGKIRPIIYSQIVDTANARLFHLRQTLQERYENSSDNTILSNTGQQALLNFE